MSTVLKNAPLQPWQLLFSFRCQGPQVCIFGRVTSGQGLRIPWRILSPAVPRRHVSICAAVATVAGASQHRSQVHRASLLHQALRKNSNGLIPPGNAGELQPGDVGKCVALKGIRKHGVLVTRMLLRVRHFCVRVSRRTIADFSQRDLTYDWPGQLQSNRNPMQ